MDPINWYVTNRPIYKRLSMKIENILNELFELEDLSFHMVTSRTKEIDNFRNKISNGNYSDPINQIQDFSGIRIITYVEDEIEQICNLILDNFDIDQSNSSDKSDALGIDKVGYKSVHYIARLKPNRLKLAEYKQFEDKCFEIQVRTILQHAWAEIEHDRNYKFTGKLPDEISRRFKLLAGSLEIADREFNNISREIDEISKGVKEETRKGNLDIELNSTSLSQFLSTRFEKLIKNGIEIEPNSDEKVLKEMTDFNLHSLEDLEKIIPVDFVEVMLKHKDRRLTEIGLVRILMIAHDYNQYFKESFNDGFGLWTSDYDDSDIFEHYGVNWNDITEKYNVPYGI